MIEAPPSRLRLLMVRSGGLAASDRIVEFENPPAGFDEPPGT